MHDNIAKSIAGELAKLNQKFERMNANHVDIGRLFKKWLEPVTAEMEELELPDRPAFTIGAKIRVVDPFSVHYKHIGTIVSIESNHIRAKFLHTEERTHLDQPRLDANQIQLLDLKKLKPGDKVKVIDPHSMVYEWIGEVIKAEFESVEVHFPNGDGGDFERRNLELIDCEGSGLEVDDIVRVSAKRSIYFDRIGTVITILADGTLRVMFPHIEGYSLFTPDEVEKTGEQPYKQDAPVRFHDVTDTAEAVDLGLAYPRHWRAHFTMSALPANWTGADYEHERMTEEAFRIYQDRLRTENGQ